LIDIDCHSIQDCLFVQYFLSSVLRLDMVVGSARHIVVLGTGGTIAGTGTNPDQSWRYDAAQLSVDQLVSAIPQLGHFNLRCEQVAQIDSKDMNWGVWQALGSALQRHLAQDDVAAIVITHGTDTLEETAYLLNVLHDGVKPIVLTAAMRPATASDADGPRNLLDACTVAQWAAEQGQGGVVTVMGGQVWAGSQVRKMHSHAVDAFDGGGAPALASFLSDGTVLSLVDTWPATQDQGWSLLEATCPPRVEIITSHADADGVMVRALKAAAPGLKGVVVACTGHGTINAPLEAALRQIQSEGVTVWRSTRVARGGVLPREGDALMAVEGLTAAQARLALVLHELGARLL
jgi:L-asparaginase